MSCFPQPPKDKNIFKRPAILACYRRRSKTIAQKGPIPIPRADCREPGWNHHSDPGGENALVDAGLLLRSTFMLLSSLVF
jgi:hypothetical protein